MSHIDIEQLKRRNPITEVVRRHGVELRGQGKRLTARCPFHEDRTPSFCVGLSLPKPLLGYERGRRRLFLTEGPFDWLTFTGWGLPACALLGTQPGRGVLQLLERARSVVLVMDNDEAGRGAAQRLSAELGGRARVLELPAGVKDVSELGARPGGRDTFFRLLGAERRDADVASAH